MVREDLELLFGHRVHSCVGAVFGHGYLVLFVQVAVNVVVKRHSVGKDTRRVVLGNVQADIQGVARIRLLVLTRQHGLHHGIELRLLGEGGEYGTHLVALLFRSALPKDSVVRGYDVKSLFSFNHELLSGAVRV